MKPPRRPSSEFGRSGHAGPGGPRHGAPHGGARHGGGQQGGGHQGRGAPDRAGGPRPASPRPDDRRSDDRRPDDRRNDERRNDDRRRDERPGGDSTLRAPRPDRSFGDRSFGDRGFGDRPRHERPQNDRPQNDRPRHPPREPSREHQREAPGNSLWIYGLHAVAAALANPARHLRRLLLTEEAEAAVAARLKRPWAVGVERSERGRLDHLLGAGAIHQGAALLVDPLAPPPLQTAIARPGPVLVLDQVTDPRNVGAILRAAAAFGVAAVITQERNAPEETGALAKAASGALETVPMLRAVNIARTLVALRAAGFWVVGLDAGGAALSGPALAQRRVALVLGSEGEGLRRLTRDTCDEVSSIAMPGLSGGGASALLDSLNVSAATAIALYELARR